MKHTAGPWDYSGYCGADHCFHVGTIQNNHNCGILFTDKTSCDVLVADVCADNENDLTARANASLISAAPELLYCLDQIMNDLPSKKDWLDPALEKMAQAAIAKAKGI
jgi:hypothetical protein